MTIARFTSASVVAPGDAVFVTAGGLADKAIARNQLQASVMGVAMESGYTGSLVTVNLDAVAVNYANLVPGAALYLSPSVSGRLVAYSGWAQEFASISGDAYLTFVGRCVSTSGLSVEISPPRLIAYSG